MKSRDSLFIIAELAGQDLDCDFTVQLVVASAIHLAHAALSEQRKDFVGTEFLSGCEVQSIPLVFSRTLHVIAARFIRPELDHNPSTMVTWI